MYYKYHIKNVYSASLELNRRSNNNGTMMNDDGLTDDEIKMV